MKRLLLASLGAAALAAGCLQHYVKGSVNDVRYHMSLDREPVPGAQERHMGIRIVMDRDGGRAGTVWVDEICYGEVLPGDRVEVTDDAEVLVNGEARQPVGS